MASFPKALAMPTKKKRTNRDYPLPDLRTTIHLHALGLQLEMIADRLQGLVPTEDIPVTAAAHRQWTRARGFIKAASTSLARIWACPDHNDADESPL